ncbi:antitoxin VbhA family protein [Nocardia sp. NPDC058666]|uniref:antitoxin VbhA family protein n=1 Tax=unclassified Nocardia TaxID=2637762 RepID=UPI00364A7687
MNDKDADRAVEAVVAGNKMAGHKTPERVQRQMRRILKGEIAVDEAVAAAIRGHRSRHRAAS